MATPIQITYQPADDGDAVKAPRSAYLPFKFEVATIPTETGAIQVAYCQCNIFVDGEVLISIANSTPSGTSVVTGGTSYRFDFDISSLLQTVGLSKYRFGVFVNFQVAVIQSDGTISDPTYLSDNSFEYNVLNLAMQNGDGASVTSHLTKYIVAPGYLLPLSHRPAKQRIGLNQEDSFPYFNADNPPYQVDLTLCYKIFGQPVFHEKTVAYTQTDVNIPFGTAELAILFPAVNFVNVAEYYLRIGNTLYTTTQVVEACSEKEIRIFFTNYLGTIDGVNFKIDLVEHITASDLFTLAGTATVQPSRHRSNRINITSNNTYTISTNKFDEEDIPWLQELADSPKAWIQTDNGRIPIVLLDGSFVLRKGTGRYRYDVVMKFNLSNDFVILRN